MDSQRQLEQIYFDECEPQIEQSSILPEVQINKEEKNYASCIFGINKPQSAPKHQHRKLQRPKVQKVKEVINSSRKINTSHIKRKITFDSSASPLKNNSPSRTIRHTSNVPGQYKTIFASKKQSVQFDSLSPEPVKSYRQSASPNRRFLYWQSYLLDSKGSISVNASELITRTLKADRDELPTLTASGAIAMMADTHEILVEKDIDQRRQIASLTKIMTAYTVVTICNTYGIKMKEHKIAIHQQASWMNGTTANLRIDEQFYIMDLLYGLLLPSGNDAGVALAQYFGKFLSFKHTKDDKEKNETIMERFEGFKEFYDAEYQKDSIKLFVFQMNKNSYKIGLRNTQFANPTGLSNSKNYSTPRDMAVLTAHCLNNNILREVFKKKVYTCQAVNQKLSYTRQVQWKNTNKHLYQFRECIGVKTGITPTAGPCLSSAYKVMNREVVIIVLNSLSIEDRYEDARSTYKWVRRNMRIC